MTMKSLLIVTWTLMVVGILAALILPVQAETINAGQIFPEFSVINVDSICVWDRIDFNTDGRLMLPMANDDNMDATAGLKGELIYNRNDDALYFCATSGDPGAWVKIKDFN